MALPSLQQLIDAACHLGHPQRKWNPKMAPYLYGTRKGIHIFDVTKTQENLQKVIESLRKLQAEGKTILFVSTKQQSIAMVEHLGEVLNQPFVTKKWIPGLLTNWKTLKQRLKYYLDLQDSFRTGEVEKYTKKEQTSLRKKLTKLDVALAGVARMSKLPDAVFVVDALRDRVAIAEAKKLGIAVFGICDSNADPDDFTAFIPGNDDAVKSLLLVLTTIEEELGSLKGREPAPASARQPVAA